MRRLAALFAMMLSAAVLLVVQSGPASSDAEPVGGVYVPVAQAGVAYATNWTGGSGAFGPGETRSYTVLGNFGVPATGVSAVVVELSARTTSATTGSYLTAWPTGTARPAATSMQYNQDNAPRSNTAVVKVGTGGAISIYNYTGTTNVTVQITGYFTSTSSGSDAGGFVPIAPIRIANSAGTATGANVPQGQLAVGGYVDIQASGVGSIGTDATAIFANVAVRDATAPGTVQTGPAGTTLSSALYTMTYGEDGPYDSGLSIKLNSSGAFRFRNSTGSPITYKIDVEGYFSGDSTQGASYTPLSPANIWSSAGSTPLAPNSDTVVPVVGHGGVPASGVGAVAMTVTARTWTSGGTVTAYDSDDAWPGTTTVSFDGGTDAGNGISSTAIVQTSHTGTITLHNTSANTVNVTLTAQGWFARTNSAPNVPNSLTFSPKRGSSTNIAEPVLSATLTDWDPADQLTATFSLYDTGGTLVWSKESDPVANGSVASVSVDEDVVQIGQTYSLKAVAHDGESSSPTTSSVPLIYYPTASVVPAPSCTTSCTSVTETTLISDTVLAPNASQLVNVTAPGVGDPFDISTANVRLTARAWSGAGSLTVSDPDYPISEPAALSYSSSDNPATGVSTTLQATPSLDASQIKVTNNGSSSVTFRVAVLAWTAWIDPSEAGDEQDETSQAALDAPEVSDSASESELQTPTSSFDLSAYQPAYIANGPNVLAEQDEMESFGDATPCPATDDPDVEPGDLCLASISEVEPDSGDVAPDTPDEPSVPFHASEVQQASALARTSRDDCSNDRDGMFRWAFPNRFSACISAKYLAKFYIKRYYSNGEYELIYKGKATFVGQQFIDLSPKTQAFEDLYRYIYLSGEGVGKEGFSVHTALRCWNSVCGGATEQTDFTEPIGPAHNMAVSSIKDFSGRVGTDLEGWLHLTNTVYLCGPQGACTHSASLDSPTIRCDKTLYLKPSGQALANYQGGCVFPDYVPEYKQSFSGNAPQTALHMAFAQSFLNTHPGSLALRGLPLTRKVWPQGMNESPNRKIAKQMCAGIKPRPTTSDGSLYTCDEYPFSSTYQGCHYGPCNVWWVPPGDNNSQGGQIGTFYKRERVIDGDPFYAKAIS